MYYFDITNLYTQINWCCYGGVVELEESVNLCINITFFLLKLAPDTSVIVSIGVYFIDLLRTNKQVLFFVGLEQNA